MSELQQGIYAFQSMAGAFGGGVALASAIAAVLRRLPASCHFWRLPPDRFTQFGVLTTTIVPSSLLESRTIDELPSD